MKNKAILSGILGLALILGSCSTSNSVVSNGLIQKRKHNKGFFLKPSDRSRVIKSDQTETEKIAPENNLAKTEDKNQDAKGSDGILKLNPVSSKDLTSKRVSENVASSDDEKSLRKSDLRKNNTRKEKIPGYLANKIEKQSKENTSTKTQVNENSDQYQKTSRSSNGSLGQILIMVLLVVAILLLIGLLPGPIGYIISLVLLILLILLLLRLLGAI